MRGSSNLSRHDLLIVFVIALGSFMAGLDGTIVNIALPSIAGAFDASAVAASWVLTAYLIVLVSLLLAASRLGDIAGYKKVFISGFCIFTIGSACCALSPSIELLILSRLLQAAGGATIAALGSVMVITSVPASSRGAALGIVAMFTMMGAALGPVAGGYLTSLFSWNAIFFVNIPIGIAAVLLGIKIIPAVHPPLPEGRLDLFGVLLIFLALSTLIGALTSIQNAHSITGFLLLLISAISWLAFIIHERRSSEPLIDLSVFRYRSFSLQNICILLLQMVMAGVLVIMPFYLELVRGISTDNAGLIIISLPLGMIVSAPIAGKIADAIGTRRPIIGGFALSLLSLFILTRIGAETGLLDIWISLFILGIGTGSAYAPLNSAIMSVVPDKDRSASSGLIKMMTNLGNSLGVAGVMLVATLAAGPKIAEVAAKELPPAALVGAFQVTFFCCIILLLIGMLLMIGVQSSRGVKGDEVPIGF